MQFDFDYSYNTPFSFISLFLPAHYAHFEKTLVKQGVDVAKFGQQFYTYFDQTVQNYTLRIIYQSGSDISLFVPSYILAATCILLANLKCCENKEMTADL
jgi:hypothetical protein